MSKLGSIVAVLAVATGAGALAQPSDPLATALPQLVADCNGAADSSKPRAMRACETLEKEGRLSLVEPAAATAYQRYRQGRLEACLRRQASPRGQSRGASSCEP
jgi:beta-lactamase class A